MEPTPRYNCAVDATMAVIEGRWKCTIICLLANHGSMRFNEILRNIGEISSRMLSRQLKELEQDGIVSRSVEEEGAVKIFYSLTDKGMTLIPVLRTIAEWGLQHAFSNFVKIENE